MSDDDVQEAKRRLPLPALMHQFGLGEHAKSSGHCPFHPDKKKSFSVFREGERWFWKCHGECGESGDEPAFLAKHKGISIGAAIQLFKEMAGVSVGLLPKPGPAMPLDWDRCVAGFTDKHMELLAGSWRLFRRICFVAKGKQACRAL